MATPVRPLPLLLPLVVAALIAVGCSSSDGPTGLAGSTTTSTTTSSPSPTTPTSAGSSTSAPGLPARAVTTRHQIEVGGTSRSYLLTLPDPAPPGPLPLVVAFHGGFGSGDQFRTTSHLDEQAAERGFVVAFPDGTVDADGTAMLAVARTWNAGRCCGPARYLEIDDLAFFDALVADVARANDVDADHVLVTGHSNGAMLAFRLACERPEAVAAVAPVAGSVEVLPCAPEQPPSVLAIHGDADQNHPLEGGRGARGVSGVAYRPMREGMDALAAAGGCSAEPAEEVRGPETVLTWTGCRGGRTIEARIVAGADHPWPGSEPLRTAAELQGRPSQAIDATQEVVDFLLAHRS